MMAYFEDENERSMRHRMEVAALHEELDRLRAVVKVEQAKSVQIDTMREQVVRLTLALDEALGIVRARNEILRQEREAGL
jgi:uncharacterized protein Yka (UPF0111/DUF47 family)